MRSLKKWSCKAMLSTRLHFWCFLLKIIQKFFFWLKFSLINVLVFSIFVYFAPSFKNPVDNSFSYLFYFLYFAISFFSGGSSFIMYMSLSSFFSQIADKEVGGILFLKISLQEFFRLCGVCNGDGKSLKRRINGRITFILFFKCL